MSPEEFDQQLHDTEVKLARLRALYEQYFQGIEKMEPHVPRKDMERTIDALRRNLPRNTALRFRMQQMVARYGTYVTYWQRIARQIEEGTYKRDIVRAQRAKTASAPHTADASGWEIDVDIDAIEEADTGPTAFDDSDVDAILGALKPMSSAPRARSIAAPAVAAAPPSAMPAIAKTTASPGAPSHGAAPTPPSGAPAPTRPPAVRTGLTAFGPARGIARPGGSVVAPLPAGAIIAPPPKAPAPPVAAPKPAVVPPPPAAVPRPPIVAPTPAAAPRPAMVMPRPAGAHSPTAPAVPAPAPSVARPAAVVDGAGVDGNAMRALYDRYTDARKKNNEGAVRFETLEESVQKMVPKLREKYGNKKVDFDVVVQNGRVGLKPKVSE